MQRFALLLGASLIATACAAEVEPAAEPEDPAETVAVEQPAEAVAQAEEAEEAGSPFLNAPLVTEIYTADPSAHVWDDGRIYIYPSHDIDAGIPDDDLGTQYAMRDYRVLSMDEPGGEVTVHDVALSVDDVPWAAQQMWAPDAAEKDGTYYLYFPAKDENGVFYIGAAASDSPTGPFEAEPEPIEGSFSMDPSVFEDEDGEYYMYFGGIWGGQLQRWATGEYNDDPDLVADLGDDSAPALMPKIARMSDDMVSFAEEPRDVMIVDENGDPILTGDHERRFFEAAWVNKIEDTYYLSYSTGDTHYIVYATADNPYGPFTYQGRILEPVQGWTNHHSIFEYEGDWYLAYHDTELSGQNHLRNVKMTPIRLTEDGLFETVDVYTGD
ncbi:glycoside hydrolase family 43 protein [Parvularcula oceani]|uniref:glycoside hydrolase family 43 protein n=1 Tax=Parvularcula oceani TaxID=1247963 RepID=UPI000564E84C|nr:glycoside hydrolase family 43 protein [Parvularcula oceani]